MPFVRVKTGQDSGKVYEVGDDTLVLGRDGGGVQVLDKAASRRHAEVFRIGDLCFIRDLESRNGTLVNEAPVTEELLKQGDRIRIGSTVLVFTDVDPREQPEHDVRFGPEDASGQTLIFGPDTQKILGLPPDAQASDKMSILYRLARALTKLGEPEPLLKELAHLTGKTLGADAAYVFVPDEGKATYRTASTWGKVGAVSVSRHIVKEAIGRRQAILTADAMQDARFRQTDSIIQKAIHSVLCVPLQAHEEISGVLYLARDAAANPFTEDDLELATLIGILGGLAVDAALSSAAQQAVLLSTVKALVTAIEMRSDAMHGHAERVAGYALAISRAQNLPPEACRKAQIAGLIHDVGMIAVDEKERTGLDRPGTLPVQHVLAGDKVLSMIPEFDDLRAAVAAHHERHDGKGGPKGLKGDQIPQLGRVLIVANAFDLLCAPKEGGGHGISVKDALLGIAREAGKAYDEPTVKGLLLAQRKGILFSLDTTVSVDQMEA